MHGAEVGIIFGFMQTVVNITGIKNQHVILRDDFDVDPKHLTDELALSDLYKFVSDHGFVSCAGIYKGHCTIYIGVYQAVMSVNHDLQIYRGCLLNVEVADSAINGSDHLAVSCRINYNSVIGREVK